MHLCKAISEARSEHAVFFLASAYIDALQHASCASTLPLQVTILPLDGVRDLRQRFETLHVLVARSHPKDHPTCRELEEACAVFETALHRLCALDAGSDSGAHCTRYRNRA